MAAIEKLICQRRRIEDEVKLLQNRIRGSHHLPSLERVKKFEADLQHHYQEYRTVYTKLLSTLPAYRYDELDEDSLRFDALHTDACVLVETLLLSYPSTGNRTTQTPSPRSNRAPRRRTPRFRSRSPSRTSEQTVPNPDVVEKPSTSSLVEQLPSSFPPDETKLEQPVSDDTPKEKLPANDPANVKANGGLAEIINSESAPTPSKPPSVTPDVQKSHRTKKATLQEETPFSPKKQVTTVAHQESPAEESPIPTCEQHHLNSTDTSQKDPSLGKESSKNVNNEIDVSPCEPSHASPDDDCAIVDLKNENQQKPPPREEPARYDSMANQFPSPPNEKKTDPKSTNLIQSMEPPSEEIPTKKIAIPLEIKPSRTAPQVSPEPKSLLLLREIPPVTHLVPKSAGSSPSTEQAQASTGAYPVFKSFRIPAGASSVVEPPEKPCIMVDPQFDLQLIYSCGHFHANPRLKKPPDEQPLRCHPSESIPECVSRTHPFRNPEEDAQYNPHLPSAPVYGPIQTTKPRSTFGKSNKVANNTEDIDPPEDTVIRMLVLR